MSTGKPKDGDLQLTAMADKSKPGAASTALVDYAGPVFKEEEEDLEIKLRCIMENVPVRVSNTSGSSTGFGSGDFHQPCHVHTRGIYDKFITVMGPWP